MASRDRTNLYISYRQSYAHHPTQSYSSAYATSTEELDTLISRGGSGADAVIEMDILPPAWADVTTQVDEILQTIVKMSAKLDKLHARHVLPGFDDKSEEEGEIERLTNQITKRYHECQRLIKDVERQAKGLSGSEAVMARNIQISLASKVQSSSTQFRKKQSVYLRKLGGSERSSTPAFMEDTSAPDFDVSISQSALRQTQEQIRRGTNDVVIAQREREIEDIAKGIIELSEIFNDLSTMVLDQGTLLDRIDYNVEMTRDNVKSAHVDLRKIPISIAHADVGGYISETNCKEDDHVIPLSRDIITCRHPRHKTITSVRTDADVPSRIPTATTTLIILQTKDTIKIAVNRLFV